MQVSGLSDRYEGAFEIWKVNAPSPKNIPNNMITGTFHWSGGVIA